MVVKMDKMLQKALLQLLLLLLHVKKRNEAKAESTISYLVHTHVFVLQALDSSFEEFFFTTFLSINFNNMTRGKMIHLKPIHYDRWWKRKNAFSSSCSSSHRRLASSFHISLNFSYPRIMQKCSCKILYLSNETQYVI